MSLSMAIIPFSPSLLVAIGERRRTPRLADHARVMADSIISGFGSLRENNITAAKTAGPAIRGTARGTMNGSFIFFNLSSFFSGGKTIFRASKNRIIPPAIEIVFWSILKNSRNTLPAKLNIIIMIRAIISSLKIILYCLVGGMPFKKET